MTLFSKIVKYIRKVVSVTPKKYLKFNSFGNTHVFKFAFCSLFSNYHLRSTVKRERFFVHVYFTNETVSQTNVTIGPMKMFRLEHETMNVYQPNVARFVHMESRVWQFQGLWTTGVNFREARKVNQFGRTYHTGATISIRLNRALRYKRAVIFVQFIRLTFSEYSPSRRLLLDMDSYYCLWLCAEEVTSRQEALLCDGCDRWQHQRCQTGITRKSTERLFGDASIAAPVQPQSLKVQDSATKVWTPSAFRRHLR